MPAVQLMLDRYDPVDPDKLHDNYRKNGWNRFDPDAAAYGITKEELERRRGLR